MLDTLAWSEGRLFTTIYGLLAPPIISFPDSGGTPTILYTDNVFFAFWVDGPRSLYTAISGPTVRAEVDPRFPPTALFPTPVGGGASTALLTTRLGDSLQNAFILGWALDEQALYWARMDYLPGGGRLVRVARASRRWR